MLFVFIILIGDGESKPITFFSCIVVDFAFNGQGRISVSLEYLQYYFPSE